ncbi:MAG: hypothetical protein ACE361_18625 [Aureliella sp.]
MEARYGACAQGLRTLLPRMATFLTAFGLIPTTATAQWIPAGPPVQIHAATQPMTVVHGAPVMGQVVHPNPFRMAAASSPRRVNRPVVVNTRNFIVFAQSKELAEQVAEAAEGFRRDLAMRWLGEELPPWSQRCPVHVTASPNLGASGETTFAPISTGVGNWRMVVNGTQERILDSVLPHEISHTILATHFAKYAQQGRFVPRWADEGACTTVEAEVEKKKHRHFLNQFLRTGRGLAFNRMFTLKDYPKDILPLYAQGHSAVQFLIDQSSPRDFIRFLDDGMATGNWQTALQKHYAYASIGQFQQLWNKWLAAGSPRSLIAYAPKLAGSDAAVRLASNSQVDSLGQPISNQPISNQPIPNQLIPSDSNNGVIDPRTIPAQFAVNPRANEPAPVRLAGGTSSVTQDNASRTQPSYLSEPSWYRDRLRAVASGTLRDAARREAPMQNGNRSNATVAVARAPENVSASGNELAGNAGSSSKGWRGTGWRSSQNASPSSLARQAVARPQEPQSVGIQVLEMGNSVPIRAGAQSSLHGTTRSSALPAGHIGPSAKVPVVR